MPRPTTASARTKLERLGDAGASLLSLDRTRPGLRWMLRVVFILLVAGGIAVAASGQISSLSEADWRLRPAWGLMAVPAFLLFQMSHMELWSMMMRWLGSPIPRVRAWAIWNVSLLGRYVPTSALAAVARIAMAEREGAPKRVTLASIAYELALTLAGAVALGSYFIATLSQIDDYWWRYFVFVVPVAAIGLVHPRVFRPMTDRMFGKIGREPIPLTLSLSRVIFFTATYGIGFLLAGLGVYGVAQLIHPIDAAHTLIVIASYCVGYALSMIGFFLPGGLGAREAGITVALATAMPVSQAITVAIAVRLVQMAIEVAYAVVTPIVARRAVPE